MIKLDDLVLNSNLTYREQIELVIGDKRGNFNLTNELDTVENGRNYAIERINFWKNWNQEYAKINKKINTQERYIKAQAASNVYKLAVYKSLITLICTKLSEQKGSHPSKSVKNLQELLWMFSAGSILIMKNPLKTVNNIVSIMRNINFDIAFYLEINFQDKTDADVKKWIKEIC